MSMNVRFRFHNAQCVDYDYDYLHDNSPESKHVNR